MKRLKLYSHYFASRRRDAFSLSDLTQIFYHYYKIKRKILSKLRGIIQEYKVSEPGAAPQKFLDLDTWILENLRRFYVLKLHKVRGLNILDIGGGMGYFQYTCNYFGHRCHSIDTDENEMYNKAINALELSRTVLKIESEKVINLGEKYDLITAFMITFNNNGFWTVEDWDNFLDNIFKYNLKEDGALYLYFSKDANGECFSRELLEYFYKKNAVINETAVHLRGRNNVVWG